MRKKWTVITGMLLFSVLIGGCGISADRYETVIAERDAARSQVGSLQRELGSADARIATFEAAVTDAEIETEYLRVELAFYMALADELTGDSSIYWDAFLGGGEAEAAETELANIQAAVTALMIDNEIASLPNPVTVPTNDMTAFPDKSLIATAEKYKDVYSVIYSFGDKDWFILFGHDRVADGSQADLVNYVQTSISNGTYTVNAAGTVTQVTTGYE